MKHWVLLFTVLWLSSVQVICAQKKQQHVSVVAFYNFENLFDTENDPNKDDDEFTPEGRYHYTDKVYKAKLHNLATVLQQLGNSTTPDGPSIIGTAEVENGKVLSDLVNQPEIKDRNYQYIWFEGHDPRGIDVALLYNPKHFQVLKSRAVAVNLSKTGGKESTRDILYVTGLLVNDTIHVLVNHWPSRRGGKTATEDKRAIVAGINKHISDSLLNRNANARILILGDLNDDPVDISIVNVLSAKKERAAVTRTSLYNPWAEFYQKGLGTLGYNDRWNLFDHIILSGAFLEKNTGKWKFDKAEIFNRDFLIQKTGRYKGYPHRSFSGATWINGYSDHFPVVVYLVKDIK